MDKKRISLVIVVAGLILAGAGSVVAYQKRVAPKATHGKITVTSVPEQVSAGEKHNVGFKITIPSEKYEGRYLIDTGIVDGPTLAEWQGDTWVKVSYPSTEGTLTQYAPVPESSLGDVEGWWKLELDAWKQPFPEANLEHTFYRIYVGGKPSYNTLTVSSDPTEGADDGGGIEPKPHGSADVTMVANLESRYVPGTEVTVTATPDFKWNFVKWTGAAESTSKTVTVTMDSDKSLVAHFEPEVKYYTLSTEVSPAGAGTIDVSPSATQYKEGKTVKITAFPAQGYNFSHWSGDASGTSREISVAMDSDKRIVANFEKEPKPKPEYTLTTDTVGEGSVEPSHGTYEEGTEVQLTADPAEGWTFKEWRGAASGQQDITTVTMDSDKSVTAVFVKKEPPKATITIGSVPSEGGSVNLTQSKNITVEKGTTVTLHAYPNDGWKFNKWQGDVSGEQKSINITITEDIKAIANFDEKKDIVDKAKENKGILMLVSGASISLIGGAMRFTSLL